MVNNFINQTNVIYLLIFVVLLLIFLLIRLNLKLNKFLLGKDAKTLEDSILKNTENIDKLNQFQRDSINYFNNIEKRIKRSIQAVETIRFNPFRGTGDGGNQSFSTALINEEGKGVVISSLYSRDRISVFSKPIDNFQSEFELTEEENEVITNSKNNLRK